MQIGTRWPVGGTAPSTLPAEFTAAVSAAEEAHGLRLGAWTLTWLEGRPVAEHPDGIRVALGADGTVSTTSAADADVDDDDWLS